jgi:acetyl/propionyl-CoA carboxylase alpha subunit
VLPAETRLGLHKARLAAAAAVNYVSAGTWSSWWTPARATSTSSR